MPESYVWVREAGLVGALFVGLMALGKRLFVPIAALTEMRAILHEHYVEMKAMKDHQIAELKTDNERWRTDYRALEEDLRRSLKIAETVVDAKGHK
jgi:hypothetical protein